VSPHWTLEYCLGRSTALRQLLFNAIVLAGEEMTADGYTGKRVSVDWATFSAGKTADAIAFDLYTQFIGNGKNISKPIIAQHLATIIETTPVAQLSTEDLLADPEIKYLVDAIQYASGSLRS
jgi:putative ATP-dependent endonuclease of the OLD family